METGESRRMQSSAHPRTCFTNIWCLKSLINIEPQAIHGLDFLTFNKYLLSFCHKPSIFLTSLRGIPEAQYLYGREDRRGTTSVSPSRITYLLGLLWVQKRETAHRANSPLLATGKLCPTTKRGQCSVCRWCVFKTQFFYKASEYSVNEF